VGHRPIVGSSTRRDLVIARSGVASASGVVSPDFLGWADRTPSTARVIINPVVLIEFTAEFLRFVDSFLGNTLGREGWRYRAVISELDVKGPVHLRTNASQRGFLLSRAVPATTTDLRVEVAGHGDWEADAFRCSLRSTGLGLAKHRQRSPSPRMDEYTWSSLASDVDPHRIDHGPFRWMEEHGPTAGALLTLTVA
jgi:hypothetical protein